MQDNYFILKKLSEFLSDKLTGSVIAGCFSQEKEQVILKTEINNVEYFLIYSCSSEFPYLYLKDKYSVANKNVAHVFEEIAGVKIRCVTISNEDRLITLELSNGNNLIFSFARGKLNLFLTSGDVIINSFKRKSEFSDKNLSEVLKARTQVTVDIRTVKEYLMNNYLKFGKVYFEEILFQLNINYRDEMNPEVQDRIDNAMQKIKTALETPEYLVYRNDNKIVISLLELSSLGNNYKFLRYENINDLLEAFVKDVFHLNFLKNTREKNLRELASKIRKNEIKSENMRKQLGEALHSEKYLEYGNIILENINNIGKNQEILEYDKNGITVSVRLQKKLSPSENAGKYFEKYKRQKSSVDLLKSRLRKLEDENSVLNDKLKEVKNMSDIKQIKKLEKSKPVPEEKDETSRFRKFIIDNNFQVWVGKDSRSNDLLTSKYSSPNDLWFHIRGTSGSHTVLKTNNITENIDKKIIQAAASICAYYSKARNAGTVPVAFCMRKYVKKKKGLKEGSVIMEREKVIFVKPELPG